MHVHRIVKCKIYLAYKDICKEDLKAMDMDTNSWEAIAIERTTSRQTMQKGLSQYEESLAQQSKTKRQRRKARSQGDRPASDYTCTQCERDCHSRIGQTSHT